MANWNSPLVASCVIWWIMILDGSFGVFPCPEAELLTLLALPTARPGDYERVCELTSEGTDWAYLIDRASRHRVIPAMYRNVNDPSRWPSDAHVPHSRTLRDIYDATGARNRLVLAEAETISRALMGRGVRHQFRKGVVIAPTVYRDIGLRQMGDIDVLVDREWADEAVSVARSLGYEFGTPIPGTRTVAPVPRRDLIYAQLHGEGPLSMTRVTGMPFLGIAALDLAWDLFLPSANHSLGLADFVTHQNTATLGATQVPFPHLHALLVDVCCHLHKDATGLAYIHLAADLQLSKFVDIVEIAAIASDDLWVQFVDLVHHQGLEEPVWFALRLTEAVYPSTVPQWVADELSVQVDLDTYSEGGRQWRWDRPFLERLFDPHRGSGIPKTQSPLV